MSLEGTICRLAFARGFVLFFDLVGEVKIAGCLYETVGLTCEEYEKSKRDCLKVFDS